MASNLFPGRASAMGGLLIAVVHLAGCAPAPLRPPPGADRHAPEARLSRVADLARSRVGAPYRYGAEGPAAFDCSGLVHFAYQKVGISVPRTVAQLRRESFPLPPSRARPGDLLFFRMSGKVSHVGIYVGDGRFVHAPSRGERVQYASIRSDFWQQHLVRAGRLR